MSSLRRIRKAARERRVELSDHALDEMDNDLLRLADIRAVLLGGALRKSAVDDPRGPRYVIRGGIDHDDVEVVCRFIESDILWVITVYVVGEVEDD